MPTKTIGNPLTWAATTGARLAAMLGEATEASASSAVAKPPKIRAIGIGAIGTALRRGLADFAAARTDIAFIVLIYPLIGVALAVSAFDARYTPYLFPLAAGFALVGPVAGILLYEISRRREARIPAGWVEAAAALGARQIGPVIALALVLGVVFLAWIFTAHLILVATLGTEPAASPSAFVVRVLTTPEGWKLAIVGTGAGFVFALGVLAGTVVAFPMLLDRQCGLPVAVATSIRVTRRNPVAVLGWGLTVAVLLALGSLPFFAGLILVLPVLGHASWHFYRQAVG